MTVLCKDVVKLTRDHQTVILTKRVSIEWRRKSEASADVNAHEELVDDVSCIILDIPHDIVWARLVVEDELNDQVHLSGISILLNLMEVQPEKPPRFSPMVAKATSAKGRKEPLVESRKYLDLAAGIWTEIRGVSLADPVTESSRRYFLLDFPKGARVALAAVNETSLPVTVAEADGGPKSHEVVVQPFAPRPWRSDRPLSEGDILYASDITVSGSDLTGWVFGSSEAPSVSLQREDHVITGAADQPFEILKGIVANVGFQIDVSETLSIKTGDLRLSYGSGVFIASFEDSALVQIRSVHGIAIESAVIDSFILKIEGHASNKLFPGVPVRMRLSVNGILRKDFVARAERSTVAVFQSQQSYQFSVSIPLLESEFDAKIQLLVVDTQRTIDIRPTFVSVAEADSAEAHLPEVQSEAPAGQITGRVESVAEDYIAGWALNKSAPDTQVELLLFTNDRPFSYTRVTAPREDVRAIFGGSGFNGFSFELAPNVAVTGPLNMCVTGLGDSSNIGKSEFTYTRFKHLYVPSTKASSLAHESTPARRYPGSISIVILNRNGGDILEETLRSAQDVEAVDELEWIVVDHDSSDNSAEVCDQAVARGMNVRFFKRPSNYSFSDSNNVGASMATGDLIVFANNDLIFIRSFLAGITREFNSPDVGIVGVRLLDHISDSRYNAELPIQHLGVFFHPTIKNGSFRPFEARLCDETSDYRNSAISSPAVTGALLAIRREDFLAVGGFDEEYSYGLEDIDLCLKVRKQLNKDVICANSVSVVHHRGYSRSLDRNSGLRRRNNNFHFNRLWGGYLRSRMKQDMFSKPGFWIGCRPTIGFIVSDVGDETSAGEFYTALELGKAIAELTPVHLAFIKESDWYDLSAVDVVVVMVNKFDIGKVRKARPHLIAINWMRQWFDRWAEDPSLAAYDLLYASSSAAADYIAERTHRRVDVLPIATNPDVFGAGQSRDRYSADYVFTGSRFGPPRQIESELKPARIDGRGVVIGYNWAGTGFQDISIGHAPYTAMPDIYASAKVALDDANIATKAWGSCNSRVFDAIAGGCLLLTNGKKGARELFGDLMPTFEGADELTEQLNHWIRNDGARIQRVAELKEIVLRDHTYAVRAATILGALEKGDWAPKVAIKCAAKFNERAQWGDFHFAESLARELRKLGYVVRVDCRESWDSGLAETDDAVIVLRGLTAYKPKPHQKSFLWLISHPDEVSIAELEQYDRVFVASQPHSEHLSSVSGREVEFLAQCTDTTRFFFNPARVFSRPDRNLYVGNSRGHFRLPVKWSVEQGLSVDIYGVGWEPFVDATRLKGQLVPNESLGDLYGSSRSVICDHWPDMKRLGYISNRVFDVLGSGGRLLVDDVPGLEELIPANSFAVFRNRDEFEALIASDVPFDADERLAVSKWIEETHSFRARAATLKTALDQFLGANP